jgi:hypothetical protein
MALTVISQFDAKGFRKAVYYNKTIEAITLSRLSILVLPRTHPPNSIVAASSDLWVYSRCN